MRLWSDSHVNNHKAMIKGGLPAGVKRSQVLERCKDQLLWVIEIRHRVSNQAMERHGQVGSALETQWKVGYAQMNSTWQLWARGHQSAMTTPQYIYSNNSLSSGWLSERTNKITSEETFSSNGEPDRKISQAGWSQQMACFRGGKLHLVLKFTYQRASKKDLHAHLWCHACEPMSTTARGDRW